MYLSAHYLAIFSVNGPVTWLSLLVRMARIMVINSSDSDTKHLLKSICFITSRHYIPQRYHP